MKRETTYTLLVEQWLPRPIDEVFAFFGDAHNLEALTPDFLHFHVLTPRPIEMCAGRLIDYKLRLRGIPMRWQSEITAWEPPHRFVDEQRRGPYRIWIHEHTFSVERGGTMIRDHVEYAAPGGGIVRRLFVAPQLERIFAYRKEKIAQIFGVPDNVG